RGRAVGEGPVRRKISSRYLAGFVDGEGYVTGLLMAKGWPLLVVAISNTHKGIMDRIAKDYGGRVHLAHPGGPRRRPCWGLKWTGPKAVRIMRLIQPYAVVKEKQIAAALSFYEWSTR